MRRESPVVGSSPTSLRVVGRVKGDGGSNNRLCIWKRKYNGGVG